MPTLINVCGPSFSGTTLLDLMLGNADDAFSCGEVANWFRPTRAHHKRLDCPCGANPCPTWARFQNTPQEQFHRDVFSRLDVGFVVDSSKRLPWIFDTHRWACQQGFRVVNLLVWKTPLSHGFSHWKRGQDVQDARYRYMRYYTRFLALRLPFVAVNFNRLVEVPAEQLAEVCRVSGATYFRGRERFWQRQHHQLFGNEGTRQQLGRSDSQIQAAESYPLEYLAAVREFDRVYGADDELQQLLAIFAAHDVAKAPTDLFDEVQVARLLPFWYYEDRVRDVLRKVFPLRSARIISRAS